jgi:chromosome segregation protein
LLKLREIELLGFKSFADRTRLHLDGSTAAVVGPNGCGKSNLADAISWVLGEQSARMLRGERMTDVIFNGAGGRLPTSLAEVSVVMIEDGDEVMELRSRPEDAPGSSQENQERAGGTLALPGEVIVQETSDPESQGRAGEKPSRRAPGEEIKVTRRLFRSGESEYLLNGEPCRLRDIHDIFMGTGLGPDSYAIIEQGRIGQILSSKPSDRRAIIEEAAGISKFKSRKRLAEAKLESSRQNLARINDILEEVSKQVNSLKRQASKAGRYRELQNELRCRQTQVLACRWVKMDEECQELRRQLDASQQACSEAAQQLEKIEAERRGAFERVAKLEGELQQTRDALAAGELEGERLRSRIENARQQAQALEERAREAEADRERLREEAARLQVEAQELNQRVAQVNAEWSSARGAAQQIESRHREASDRLTSLEAESERRRQELLQAVSRLANLRNEALQAQEMGASLDRQLDRAEEDRVSAEQERDRLAAELDRFQQEHQSRESELAALGQSVAEAETELVSARAERTAAQESEEILGRELSAASARKEALEESLARHSYAADGVRRLLSISSSGNGFHALGVVADFVEVSPGFEEVVEEFLKAELDGVVVEEHHEARSGISLLEGNGGGRSTFFVRQLHSNGNGHGPNLPDMAEARGEPGVVASLQEVVRLERSLGLNGDLPFPILAHSFIVEDAATAERLAAVYPSAHFLTRRGEHYHHRLVSAGKTASAGPLALRRDFHEWERKAGELRVKRDDAERRLSEAEARMGDLTLRLARLKEQHVGIEKRGIAVEERLTHAREGLRRAAERVQVLERETAQLTEEREEVRRREAAVRENLDHARGQQERFEAAMNDATESVRQERAQLEQLNHALTDAQMKATALEERWRAAEAECKRVKEEAERAQANAARIESESDSRWEEARRLKATAAESEVLLEDILSRAQTLSEQCHAQAAECASARAQRDQLEPQASEARSALDSSRDKRAEIDVALAGSSSDLNHLIQQCCEELGSEPATLYRDLPPENALEGEALGAAEDGLHEMKAKLERMGPVNMMALEELQEAEERFSFLETQRQDLLASINDTTQTIREIDQASRSKFAEAFTAINGFFAESFRTLFGGGSGEMRYSDEADPESGIDLAVQPPGKRLQNVLLLSGGEKALTALALLIAVFRFTPSPFCILDEVDAPLDDSNVIRFAEMIRRMSRTTQFILITHNKRSMETCPMMYGVTMEEAGVSKLVSVRFEAHEPAEGLAQAVPA